MSDFNSVAKFFPVQAKLEPESRKSSKSPESRYWKSFKNERIAGLISPVTFIDFSSEAPHDFAVTCSTSVTIYDGSTFEQKSSISSFTDVAFSGVFRSDGKLFAAGGNSGLVQIFDLKTRLPLRRLSSHLRPVHLVRYPFSDKLHIFSGGDDSLLNYWDVSSGTLIHTFQDHKDYVRSGSPSPTNSDVFLSGSYDHTVKLWDCRVSSPVLNINHGNPVEDAVFLPLGGLVATAGGNSVKIWDVIGGGRLISTMDDHNKTVTSIRIGKFVNDKSMELRLLTVGLDGYIKAYDYSSFKVTHSMRFPAPLLSLGFSPVCSARVIGTSNGILYVGKKKQVSEKVTDEEPVEARKRVIKHSRFRYFERGQSERPSEDDYVIARKKRVKLAVHDQLLKKFCHKEALVSVLSSGSPKTIMALIEELVARKKLLKSIENLDTGELELLLMFLHRYSTKPQYAGYLIGLAKKVMQMRAEDIHNSSVLQKHALNLKRMILEEIRIQVSLQEIQGIISPLLRLASQ